MKYTLRRGLKYGFIASTIILVILFFGPQIGNYLPNIAKWTYYPLRDVVNFF